jgi:AsmA protein
MGRLLKIIFSIIAIIIVLIVAAIVILPLVVDPNDFKPEIQAAVKDSTGRDLLIEGDLQLSVFPWLGVSTGKLSLSNAPGFADKVFAEIAESNVKVKLLPLLSKELEVSRVVLKGLVLNLAKNKQGVSNWDDLTKKDGASATSTATDVSAEKSVSPLAALAIGGISIEQAKISWDDRQQDQYVEINDFNFTTGKLTFDQAIDLDLSLTVVNKEPELTESIVFSSDLVVNEQLDIFKLNAFNLKSITKGKGIPGEVLKVDLLAEIAIDLTQQTLNIAGLKLNTAGLTVTADINGTGIKDKPVFTGPIKIAEFNLVQFMKNMAMPLPAMQDASALSKLSADFMLHATANSADIQKINIKLDDTAINGSASINNFADPAIKFNFNVDAIDADRYLAPKKAGEKAKAVATPASAVAASATLFPVETLRGLNANGLLSIGSLKINQLKMQGLSLTLNAKNGVIKTQQVVKQLYQGAYNGNSTINVKNRIPSIALNERLTKVDIQPLLTDMLGEARMSGTVNASAKIQGYGNTAKAIKSSLGGKLDFNFSNGVIKGFNIQKIIDSGKALLKGAPLPADNKNDQTVFSIIKGTANINNGLVTNDDLYLEASKLRVNGKGTASLVTDKLDYQVKAKLLKTVATATEAEKIKGMPIIINVGGTIAEPSYQLDLASMLLEKNKKKVDKFLGKNKEKINKKADELLKKLDEKVGPGVGDLIKGFL